MENNNDVNDTKEKKSLPIGSFVILAVLIVFGYLYSTRVERVSFHPARGINGGMMSMFLPWGNMGMQMINSGVIDREKFEKLYASRGGLSEADKKLLYDDNKGEIEITKENSQMMLNMLWAFGLANDNPILKNGPMMDPRYGGAGNFASTGGWNLAKGNAMDHYSTHQFITLTPEQQALVERVTKNIYRPCCDNSTYFPDCNHGMAMLGLLEILASRGATEAEMYKVALEANTLWFPSQYEVIKSYFASKNIDWNTADPKEILGANYSSASGFRNILSQVKPVEQKGGASCGA